MPDNGQQTTDNGGRSRLKAQGSQLTAKKILQHYNNITFLSDNRQRRAMPELRIHGITELRRLRQTTSSAAAVLWSCSLVDSLSAER